MRSSGDAIDIVWGILNASALKTAIAGGIYKLIRPVGNKEDVVINSLPITGNLLQKCTLNVNIFVPDLNVTIDGQAQKLPNTARLKALANIATGVLKEQGANTYHLAIDSVTQLQDQGSWYINIRLTFQNVNFQYYE